MVDDPAVEAAAQGVPKLLSGGGFPATRTAAMRVPQHAPRLARTFCFYGVHAPRARFKLLERILYRLPPMLAMPGSPQAKIENLAHNIADVPADIVPEHIVRQ
jgi:hypothetical protein